MATAEFSKFAGILSATLSQHHLSGFEIAQIPLNYEFWSHLCMQAGLGFWALNSGGQRSKSPAQGPGKNVVPLASVPASGPHWLVALGMSVPLSRPHSVTLSNEAVAGLEVSRPRSLQDQLPPPGRQGGRGRGQLHVKYFCPALRWPLVPVFSAGSVTTINHGKRLPGVTT